ncbi:MAG: type III pantothenate kinase [Planctomycetaceae bacterium]
MSAVSPAGALLVADVGNTRIKLAAVAPGAPLPAVGRRQDVAARDIDPPTVERWLAAAAPGPAVLLVASVNEAAAARLEALVTGGAATGGHSIHLHRIGHADLPIPLRVDEPDRVGIDRACGAAAAAVVRPGRPVVVVDCGTATTVNLVSAAGEFLGGAILPGPVLLARALAAGTCQLPEVEGFDAATPPPLPGRSTGAAIAAGLGWGMRGAVARIVAEGRAALGGDVDVILTGGSAAVVRDALPDAIEIPDLVLAGIALAAERLLGRARDSG